MKTRLIRKDKSLRRKRRVAYKIGYGSTRPRLFVFRSNKYIYAQILDNSGRTITGISSKVVEAASDVKGKTDISFKTGKALAQKAKEKNITEVVFNRGSYKYHGRVKALADGARDGGLKF
ncbi:MAG: 50S ribosomal protein L18 [Actinobacteria bacterium]|nr:50S ribosomal protein L18 [Actinomycetota bacterium]